MPSVFLFSPCLLSASDQLPVLDFFCSASPHEWSVKPELHPRHNLCCLAVKPVTRAAAVTSQIFNSISAM